MPFISKILDILLLFFLILVVKKALKLQIYEFHYTILIVPIIIILTTKIENNRIYFNNLFLKINRFYYSQYPLIQLIGLTFICVFAFFIFCQFVLTCIRIDIKILEYWTFTCKIAFRVVTNGSLS
jgi:hypothetical protein